ncbi:MAG: acyl-CoA dehydratase activase [Opitutaceae bacterium]|jgi:predicted CoA-substrate-specific enzyme activase|nr:acyl-CoA dehydratase activase [Opitutaceae bacterium]
MSLPTHNVGLDIGSTTLKIVFDNPGGAPLHTDYRRHQADVPNALLNAFADARAALGPCNIRLAVTGSAGMGLAERCRIPFIQEVVAAAEVVQQNHPGVRTLVDIGGEDAKMIFFNPNRAPDIRMNGSCAGGTGAFIDQMAALLAIPVNDLGPLAEKATHHYPIASRCGVFSKTDVQNLMARKAAPADIAASILDAVALQVITTLSRGFDVTPTVLFCGGVLAFNPALRNTFQTRLALAPGQILLPPNPHLLPATGCAIMRDTPRLETTLDAWLATLSRTNPNSTTLTTSETRASRLPPLFANPAERQHWQTQITRHALPHTDAPAPGEPVYLGIDSGSTTTKIVLIDQHQRLLWTRYAKNNGDPLQTAADALRQAAADLSPDLPITASAVTGYGEDLLKAAFNLDYGLVETMAHYTAARKFHPRVTFILDIGGQDMKAAFIRNNTLHRIEINEACSSGCGTFIENFATSLNIPITQFASMACNAAAPADLGTRCTVFMNSKVKQALREGATPADIAAGLSYSVIKNCLHKVLRLRNTAELGDAIVVQGGTFRNDSIARAFEKISGHPVIRPDKPELMGAYGAALHAQRQPLAHVQIPRPLKDFATPAPHATTKKTCPGCPNACAVTCLTFDNGNHHHFGNQCEKIFFSGKDTPRQRDGHNLHTYKYNRLFPAHLYPPE